MTSSITPEPASALDAASLAALETITVANPFDGVVSGTVAVTGVATAANQATEIGHLDGVEGLLTTIDADTGNLAGILTAVQLIDNVVSGSEAQVDVVAALPAGDNNIGNVDVVSLPALVAGTANIGDVDVLTVITGTGATNLGKAIDTAVGATDTGVGALVKRLDLPVTLTPASGDWVPQQVNSMGATYVTTAPHSGLVGEPYTATGFSATYSTAQTGTALVTPAGGKKVVCTYLQIQAGGTVAGTVVIWFGASGDTTYSRGTDLAIFDGEFAPSATSKPGYGITGCWPASAADHILRITSTNSISPLTVTVWTYQI